MDTAVQQAWTQQQFFAWAEVQDKRYEFDGVAPVEMTGGNLRHGQITGNILFGLHDRLRQSTCTTMGPNAGVATIGRTIRYPDALVTRSPFAGSDRLAPAPLILFEVISPTSGTMDRIIKLREYQTIESVLRYIIVESDSVGLTVLTRPDGKHPWTATGLTSGDTLDLPELATNLPVDVIYDRISFD